MTRLRPKTRPRPKIRPLIPNPAGAEAEPESKTEADAMAADATPRRLRALLPPSINIRFRNNYESFMFF